MGKNHDANLGNWMQKINDLSVIEANEKPEISKMIKNRKTKQKS